MLGREVQYGSAVQLDGLLCGVVHNALYCVMMMGTKIVQAERKIKYLIFSEAQPIAKPLACPRIFCVAKRH